MEIGSIFVILGLILLVGLFISRPFFETNRSDSDTVNNQQEHELSSLLAERDRVISALQELDFDYKLGKIPEEDYPTQRSRMLLYGANVLRQLDTFQPQPGVQEVFEDRIEVAIAARKATQTGTAPQPSSATVSGNGNRKAVIGGDDDLETLIANRRRARPEKSAGFCPKCGNPVQQSDRFCPKCGNSLA